MAPFEGTSTIPSLGAPIPTSPRKFHALTDRHTVEIHKSGRDKVLAKQLSSTYHVGLGPHENGRPVTSGRKALGRGRQATTPRRRRARRSKMAFRDCPNAGDSGNAGSPAGVWRGMSPIYVSRRSGGIRRPTPSGGYLAGRRHSHSTNRAWRMLSRLGAAFANFTTLPRWYVRSEEGWRRKLETEVRSGEAKTSVRSALEKPVATSCRVGADGTQRWPS